MIIISLGQERNDIITITTDIFQGRILFYWIKIKFNDDNMIWSKNKFKMKRLMREKM